MEDLKSLMWESIEDMPIYNWFKLSNNQDYNQLLIKPDKLVDEKNIHLFEERSKELTQEYLDRFGASQDSEFLLILLKSKIRLQCELIETGRKFIKIQIKQIEEQIINLLPKEQAEIDIFGSLVRISEFMKYAVKAKETSVVEYKHLTILIEEKNKQAESWQNNQ